MNTCIQLLEKQWEQGKFVCVGLDPDREKFPAKLQALPPEEGLFEFTRDIIDATAEYVACFKPNSAFFEAHGKEGWIALQKSISYIKTAYPAIPVILDAKRADIESTNLGYTKAIFDTLQADATTIHPYLGRQAVDPFLQYADKCIFVLTRTSNPGAGEFQDLVYNGEPLYLLVAKKVTQEWNTNKNCGLVVGATYPEELKKVRAVAGDIPILIPGIGAQGGDIESTVKNGKDSRGWGMIISSSRSVLYASNGDDFVEAAGKKTKDLHEQIQRFL